MTDSADAKSGITTGRRQIFSNYLEVTEENIEQILSEAFAEHLMNVSEINFLKRYERGEQPILNRVKEVRPEINNKVVENNAHVAIQFIIGFQFGQPIAYVQRSKKDADSQSDKPVSDGKSDEIGVGILNEMMFEQGKASKDLRMAKDFKVCGSGYRMILPNRHEDEVSPFEIMVLDPRTTFVVYTNDAYREPLLAVSYTELKNGDIRFGAYSKTQYFELVRSEVEDKEKSVISGKKKKEKVIWNRLIVTENGIGEIPIIEFVNDYERMGAFERAIPVMDALNLATSDRLNDIAQHVQSLLWLHNAELAEDDKKNLREGGIILTKNNDGMQANIKYLESVLDQSATQSLVDYLYDQFLQLVGIPGREQSTGGNTGTAIMLSNGWQLAESYANTSDLIFNESEMQSLRVALKICRNLPERFPESVRNLKLSDIEIHHGRKKDYELVSKANALKTLIDTGVDGNIAFTTVNLFPDSQQAWNDSRPMVEALQRKLIADINQSAEQQKQEPGANTEEIEKTAELETEYQGKTADTLVSSIMESYKQTAKKIDKVISGESKDE